MQAKVARGPARPSGTRRCSLDVCTSARLFLQAGKKKRRRVRRRWMDDGGFGGATGRSVKIFSGKSVKCRCYWICQETVSW